VPRLGGQGAGHGSGRDGVSGGRCAGGLTQYSVHFVHSHDKRTFPFPSASTHTIEFAALIARSGPLPMESASQES
jgi:hypothetical protein